MKTDSRAHITKFAAINWRGMPGQVLPVDRLITALEGPNGSGKTTTLAAFYIGLLPDLSLVKISNIGEDDSSGGESGLHGKLGGTGPSYVLLEIQNPRGERVISGVQLLPKTAPSVEIKGLFVIKGLVSEITLEHLLALDSNEDDFMVPDIPGLRERVGLFGGVFKTFETVSEYGAELFDQGVAPIKFSDKKSRAKFNKLLQTSFQGGFSKSLQDRLKDYLLAEDSNIGDSIDRMQDNMKRCRETRALMKNLSEKIELVEGVQSAGTGIVKAMVSGVRLHARHQLEKVTETKKVFIDKQEDKKQKTKALDQLKKDLLECKEKYGALKEEVEGAREVLSKEQKACGIANQLKELDVELATVAEELSKAQSVLLEAEQEHGVLQETIRVVNGRFEDICERLSDAQKAWRKISEESGLYQMATECLQLARETLPKREVSKENAKSLLVECETKTDDLCQEVGSLDRKISGAKEARKVFGAAYGVLTDVVDGRQVPIGEAYVAARDEDRRLEDMERFVRENANIEESLSAAQAKAEAQVAIRSAMAGFGARGVFVKTAGDLLNGYERVRIQKAGMDLEVDETRSRHAEIKAGKAEVELEIEDLQSQVPRWLEVDALRIKAGNRYGRDFAMKATVIEQIEGERKREKALCAEISDLGHEVKKVEEELSLLVNNRSSLDPRLEKIERALDGQLVATQYEDIALEDAVEQEARLGPLVNAIVVGDVPAAIEKIDGMKNVPEDLWLVEKGAIDDGLRKLKKLSSAIVAPMADKVWRITQFSKFPKIGHLSRKRRIDFLREQKDELRGNMQEKNDALDVLRCELNELGSLLARVDILEGEDPRVSLEKAEERKRQVLFRMKEATEELDGLLAKKETANTLMGDLQRWLPDARLLDEENYLETVAQLEQAKEKVEQAKAFCARKREVVEQLRSCMENLRHLPPSDEELDELEKAKGVLSADWQFWETAKGAVFQLVHKLDHFQYEQSFRQLQRQQDPTEELKVRKEEVKGEQEEVKSKEAAQSESVQTERLRCNGLDATCKAKAARVSELRREFEALGVVGTEAALAAAQKLCRELESDLEQKEGEVHGLETSISSLSGKIEVVDGELKRARSEYRESLLKARPLLGVRRFAKKAVEGDLTLSRLWVAPSEVAEGFSSFEDAYDDVDGKRHELVGQMGEQVKRESAAGDSRGQRVLDMLLGMPRKFGDKERVEKCLELWGQIREYISQILPRDCVHTDDPLLAAQKMHARQKSLELTLAEQEHDFRTDSETVANSIRGRIREERRKIRKLGVQLQRVSFGNIAAIDIEFSTRDEMMSILEAMIDKDQFELFAEGSSLQEAMAKVYTSITGGKVQGDDLLDYRKYIDLNVRIKRKGAEGWDKEKKLNLSTGEAIGVGAAVLMVILGTWEEQMSFFRDPSLRNSMRFLFMDEATRLDSESIKTMLDLCQRMGIQILIAGPQFNGDDCGSGITYSLCRRTGNFGEEVVVRGRRGFGQRSAWMAGVA